MTTETCGVIYSAMRSLDIDADKVCVVLHGKSGTPLRRVVAPRDLLEKLKRGHQMSERAMFGAMVYEDL